MKSLKFNLYAIPGIICLMFISAFSRGQQTNNLSDPEVAFVAVTANQIDIDYASIALKRSKNTDVINFAKTMTNDHKAIIQKATDLVNKLGVKPTANSVSAKMLSDAENTRKQLNASNDKDFDKAYINNEVNYHKAVIDAVENRLIPDSENADLKNLLVSIVPALKEHLSHAEMIQSKFQ